jgi:hypothetical protein
MTQCHRKLLPLDPTSTAKVGLHFRIYPRVIQFPQSKVIFYSLQQIATECQAFTSLANGWMASGDLWRVNGNHNAAG